MKQHITVKQLEDFVIQDEERATKLIESILEEVDFYNEAILVEYLTIGRMTEILSDKFHFIRSNIDSTDYYVEIIKDNKLKGYHAKELCDALWEAVKEIL